MGKRSSFPRYERDAYDTPLSAVLPLHGHLPQHFRFVEPCAGDGRLIDHLGSLGGACVGAFDLVPRRRGIMRRDACNLTVADVPAGALLITNPPHTARLMHPLIEALSDLGPCWLLLKLDWFANRHATPYVGRVHEVVPIGRVSWMENGVSGKENYVWARFGRPHGEGLRWHPRLR